MNRSQTNASPLFTRNLRVLARAQPALAKRLARPSVDAHIEGDPVHLRVHRSRYRLGLAAAEVETAFHSTHGDSSVLMVFGVGLGELVTATLKRHPTAKVVAWDRDPAMIRRALERVDVAVAIQKGRLRFALCADFLNHLPCARENVVFHPLLKQIYHWEAAWFDQPIPERRALLCVGGLFVDDAAEVLQAQGFGVVPWEIHRLSTDELAGICTRVRPDFVFAINHTHGLAEACRGHGVPLIVWEIDPATDGLKPAGTRMDHVAIHTYRDANVERFRAAGFPNVTYTPLAANTARRVPPDSDERKGPAVCFVGASMVDQAHRFRHQFLDMWVAYFGQKEGVRQQGSKLLDAVLAAQRTQPRNYVIPTLLQKHLEAFVDATTSVSTDDPVAMVAEMAAAERRLNVVARLGGEGIHVWGDPGWKAVVPHGAVYRGYAGHNHQLTAIYQSGQIHVDVNRLYQLDIVPMRVFDILACGGFLIAEYSAALDALFQLGVEVETWRSVPELVEKVRYYKLHPDKAVAIAQRGLDAVRARHSIADRIEQMIAAVPIPRSEVSAG